MKHTQSQTHIFPVTATVVHVQRHKDSITTDLNTLSPCLPTSSLVDSRTLTGLNQLPLPPPNHTYLAPFSQAVLVLNGNRVTSKLSTQASLTYCKPILQDYFQDNLAGILLLGSKPGHVGKSECIPAKLSSK